MTIPQVRKNLEDRQFLVTPLRGKPRVPKVGNPLFSKLNAELTPVLTLT